MKAGVEELAAGAEPEAAARAAVAAARICWNIGEIQQQVAYLQRAVELVGNREDSPARVATISALVLSLLLSTAKSAYDARGSELVQLSADILLLDRVLDYYGPDASEARLQLEEIDEFLARIEAMRAAGRHLKPGAIQIRDSRGYG